MWDGCLAADLVKLWSNAGQTLVKRWSSAGQTLVERWSNAGQTRKVQQRWGQASGLGHRIMGGNGTSDWPELDSTVVKRGFWW